MPSSLMLLSNPHRPDPRVFRESKILHGHGVAVRVIAWDRERKHTRREEVGHADVVRVGPRSSYRSFWKVLSRLPLFWLSALKVARGMNFDVVHSHDLDTLPAGVLIARLHQKPLVYDAHEIYSSMIQKEAKGLSRLVWSFERRLAKLADVIVTVNESLAKALGRGRTGTTRLVRNSPDTGFLDGADPSRIRDSYGLRGFVISYLGSLEPGRFVPELISSIKADGKVDLVIGGTGTLSQIAEKASAQNRFIKYLGSVDSDEALRITHASDLVVAMLDPANPNYRVSTPVKILDAMACGRPFVTSEGIEISTQLGSIGCGFVIPYDVSAFSETLDKAMASPKKLADMGRKGREYYAEHFSWEKSRDELIAAYHDVSAR